MEPCRPAKRIRHACEQCRRKKSKCSGDRPVCTTCWRLRQHCFYDGEPPRGESYRDGDGLAAGRTPTQEAFQASGINNVQSWDHRIITLESTVNRILGTINSTETTEDTVNARQSSSIPQSTQENAVEHTALPLTALIGDHIGPAQARHLRKTEIDTIGESYLKFCSCQPLLLFPTEGFVDSLYERSDATLFAIIATSLKYSCSTESSFRYQDSHVFRDAAQSLVTDQIMKGEVGVSTLQTLCLLALFDFVGGNGGGACSTIALTSMLAQGLDFRAESSLAYSSADQEIRCCYWSIILLRRLLGVQTPLAITFDPKLQPYPSSCSMPTGTVLRSEFTDVYEQSEADNGVMVFVFEMSNEWPKVMGYVRDCLSSAIDVSPWLTTSRYAMIMAGVMDIESRLQPLHRYKHIKFRQLTVEDLNVCREYWAPWLLSRFLYHTMVCLLNHPLLIILQLQARGNDSELFREQTSFYVARHVRWLLHFIAFIEARDFCIADPVLGYCAAVVATIELQLIFSVDDVTAEKKKRNIESCRRLIRKLGTKFALMTDLDRELGALKEAMLNVYASNVNHSGRVSINLSQIRHILDICPGTRSTSVDRGSSNSAYRTATPTTHGDSSCWVRLSRRPSVDIPDDGGSPTQEPNMAQPVAHGQRRIPSVERNDQPVQSAPLPGDISPPFAHLDFPANLYFTGISQDAASWWSGFDTYDPDCPSF